MSNLGAIKLLIGRADEDRHASWDGLIDDLRIYNRVLSAEETWGMHVGVDTEIFPVYRVPTAIPVYGVALVGSNLTTEATMCGQVSSIFLKSQIPAIQKIR